MIGVLSGKVLFSDGQETIIKTPSGIGYQTYCQQILPEGELASLFISHIIRETAEDLYGFGSLREKKLFEMLITVKGVGPKSAFNLVSGIAMDDIIMAIQSDQKKVLTRVSGIGAKAASQMVLDLQSKIQRIKMYASDNLIPEPALANYSFSEASGGSAQNNAPLDQTKSDIDHNSSKNPDITPDANPAPDRAEAVTSIHNDSLSLQNILDDTLLACQNLGFHNDRIVPLAQKILRENDIKKPEQLVHLVLKEI